MLRFITRLSLRFVTAHLCFPRLVEQCTINRILYQISKFATYNFDTTRIVPVGQPPSTF